MENELGLNINDDFQEYTPRCWNCGGGITAWEAMQYGNRCTFHTSRFIIDPLDSSGKKGPCESSSNVLHAIIFLLFQKKVSRLANELYDKFGEEDGIMLYHGCLAACGVGDVNSLFTIRHYLEFIKELKGVLKNGIAQN